MITYYEIVSLLEKQVYRRGINYSLDNFRNFLAEIGAPQHNLKKVIHIAGTNGKGSTLTYIAGALSEAGYKVGTFTSPHINNYTERIRFAGEDIAREDFCSIFDDLYRNKKITERLTEFEILTAISFIYFSKKKPDYVIYETGLGGRLDATNVVSPLISVITSIGFDHKEILGRTLSKIAKEKAGIIKSSVPVITVRQPKAAQEVIRDETAQKGACLHVAKAVRKIPEGCVMAGNYQKQNYGLAKKALMLLDVPKNKKNKLLLGMAKAFIWGRYTKIVKDNKTVIVDAAHNLSGMKALVSSLKNDYPDKKFVFVIGILKRKDARSILREMAEIASRIIYSDFDPGNSYSFLEIKEIAEEFSFFDVEELKAQIAIDAELVVYTGSIYFLSLAKVPGSCA
jgi:dihydrofolate synthase / folylpolyglutamate synthase